MAIDYKLHKIIETDSGSQAVYRVYEGDVTTEDEEVMNFTTLEREATPVTRYRRTNYLGEKTLPISKGLIIRDEVNKELEKEAQQRKVPVALEEHKVKRAKARDNVTEPIR